jgi:uncharacterized membrane protein YebE (DUF533 family)
MAGFTDILGSMLQQGMSPSRTTRVSNALGGRSGDLGAVLDNIGQILGQGSSEPPPGVPRTQSRPSPRPSSGGGGLGDIIGSLAGNKAVLGGLGALAAAILGGKNKNRGRTSAKSLGGGWMAMLASLAFAAMKHAGNTPKQAPRALLDAQSPADEEALEQDAEIIVKAMINAAKADGQVDNAEIQNIIGKLGENGLTDEEKEFLVTEVKKPQDMSAVIAAAKGQPDMAAQIYAASLLAIEVDTPAEQEYIRELARGLGLSSNVTSHIEQTLGMA